MAGQVLDADGKSDGSLVVTEVQGPAGIRGAVRADPYAKAGLFASVEIRPWNWTFNQPAQA